MSLPRRRIIRPEIRPAESNGQHQKAQSLRARLERERDVFKRWMSRLRRAFHAVEKQQQRISRIERQILKLEGE